jgi:hypothetical protein
MVRRHLAVEASDVPQLVEQIRRLRTDADLLSTMQGAAEAWVEGRDLAGSLGEIQALYASLHPTSTAVSGRTGRTGVTGEG